MRRNLAQDRYPWQRMQGDNKKHPEQKSCTRVSLSLLTLAYWNQTS